MNVTQLAAVIIGSVLVLAGLAGCFLPIVPGPPLSYVALLVMGLASGCKAPVTVMLLIGMGVVTAVVSVADYFVPLIGARRFGATRWGLWGAVLGLIAGLVLFPPFGLIAGTLLGAVIGEVAGGKEGRAALRAGVGVFVGSVVSFLLKLAAWAVITYYFVAAAVECYAG